jgi:hypothetical protein
VRRDGFLLVGCLAVAADPREHDSSKIGFQQSVRLRQRFIKSGAFFKFAWIQIRLAQHLLGGSAAFGAHRIKFKNNSGCPANRQFYVLLSLSHADRIALPFPPRYVQKADSSIRLCLTSGKRSRTARGRLDVRRKIRHLKNLPNLEHVAVLRRAALHPIDDLLLGLRFQHPITADHFPGRD